MRCFYNTSNTINLVSATKYTAFWVIEYCIFVKDLVDCSATTHGIIFAKYVAQITKQQGRYAVGHRVLRFRSWAASHPTLANFMTFVVATLAFFDLNSRAAFCGFWLIDDSRFRIRTPQSSTHNPRRGEMIWRGGFGGWMYDFGQLPRRGVVGAHFCWKTAATGSNAKEI
jgi:hypothetical protein